MKYIPVQNFRCSVCGQTRVSMSRHDFAQCPCGNFVDGGFDYSRGGGKPEHMKRLPLYLKVGGTKCQK